MLLGATASTLGQALSRHFGTLRWIAGALILVMGLHFLGVIRIPLLFRQARVEVERRPATLGGAYLVGLAFGFGWTPCVGPVLAAILFIAGDRGLGRDRARRCWAAMPSAWARPSCWRRPSPARSWA